mmetsp:Transcript_8258/g.21332  ORF Transcript_8258/g.21332 Transcript_8258/m.21332 type:complete len:213 (-) Transcript_8258:184-822(-)
MLRKRPSRMVSLNLVGDSGAMTSSPMESVTVWIGGHLRTKSPDPGTTMVTSVAQLTANWSSQSTMPYRKQERKWARTKTMRINWSSRRCPGLIDSASLALVMSRPHRARRARRTSLRRRARRARRLRRRAFRAAREHCPSSTMSSITCTGNDPMTSSQNQPLRYDLVMTFQSLMSETLMRLSAVGSMMAVRKFRKISIQKHTSTLQSSTCAP